MCQWIFGALLVLAGCAAPATAVRETSPEICVRDNQTTYLINGVASRKTEFWRTIARLHKTSGIAPAVTLRADRAATIERVVAAVQEMADHELIHVVFEVSGDDPTTPRVEYEIPSGYQWRTACRMHYLAIRVSANADGDVDYGLGPADFTEWSGWLDAATGLPRVQGSACELELHHQIHYGDFLRVLRVMVQADPREPPRGMGVHATDVGYAESSHGGGAGGGGL